MIPFLQSLQDIIRADEPAPKRRDCRWCGGTGERGEGGGGCSWCEPQAEDSPELEVRELAGMKAAQKKYWGF